MEGMELSYHEIRMASVGYAVTEIKQLIPRMQQNRTKVLQE